MSALIASFVYNANQSPPRLVHAHHPQLTAPPLRAHLVPTFPPPPPLLPPPLLFGSAATFSASGWLSLPHLDLSSLSFSLYILLLYSLNLSLFTSPFSSVSHLTPPTVSSWCVVGLQLVLQGMSEALVDRRAAPALITLCSGPELWVNQYKN